MKRIAVFFLGLLFLLSVAASAGNIPKTQVARILDYKSSLELSDSQVKRLEVINKNSINKMVEAKGQANIRMMEIEKFTSNWTNMNGTAVRELINEYYDYMAKYKSAEINAIMQARSILSQEQLNKFQQLVSMETLMIELENGLSLN